MQDSDVQQLDRLLTEAALLEDTESKQVNTSKVVAPKVSDSSSKLARKPFKEEFPVNAVLRTDITKKLGEVADVSDSTFKQLQKVKTQSIQVTDAADTEAELFRSREQAFTVSDQLRKSLARRLQQKPDLDAAFADTASLTRSFEEEVKVLDAETTSVFKQLLEDVGVQDVETSVGRFFRDVSAVYNVNDSDLKQVDRALTEEKVLLDNTDTFGEFKRFVQESIEVDILSILIEVEPVISRTLTEKPAVQINRSAAVGKNVRQNISVNPVFNRRQQVFRSFSETAGLTDVAASGFVLRQILTESFSIEDVVRQADIVVLLRRIALLDEPNRVEQLTGHENKAEPVNPYNCVEVCEPYNQVQVQNGFNEAEQTSF